MELYAATRKGRFPILLRYRMAEGIRGRFPYDETDDQLAAIEATKKDMKHEDYGSPHMEMLAMTEIAIQAAFKAVSYG